MVKYKCNDCGKAFKGDYSTKVCPECKSENISEVTSLLANKTNRILLVSIIAVAILTVLTFFLFVKPSKIEAAISDDETSVTVTISGVSVGDLKELYQVQVYTEEGKSKEILFFDGNNNFVSYSKNCMLPGRSYSFVLEKIGGGKIPNLICENMVYKCDEVNELASDEPIDFGPEITAIQEGKPNLKTRKYDGVTIVVKKEGNYTYSLGNIEQKGNVFNNVDAGDYVVKVSDAQGRTSEKTLSLPAIPKGEIEKLTVAKAQSVFDNLAKHQNNITLGTARSVLSRGDVTLVKPVGQNTTLFQALMEADSDGTEFIVVSFETDDLGKIKSGTLVLRYK